MSILLTSQPFLWNMVPRFTCFRTLDNAKYNLSIEYCFLLDKFDRLLSGNWRNLLNCLWGAKYPLQASDEKKVTNPKIS